MNKYFLTFFLFIFSSYSYASERTLGTPAERLVGHWLTKAGDNLYYAKIGANGRGDYISVQPSGRTFNHQYKIVSQIPDGERAIVQLLFSDGDKRDATYVISKDGKKLTSTSEILGMYSTTQLKYIDGKTNP